MAEIGTLVMTLEDWAKSLDPDGSHAEIVEMLSQTNEILDDMLWIEGNLPTGHQTTVRTGLPAVFWRLLNTGTQPSKSTKAQITDAAAMLDAWSEIDVKLARLNANTDALRAAEAESHLESMTQEMASTLFFGNAGADPEEFNGFAVRFSDLSAVNGVNIIDGLGVGGDNSSIWLIVWGINQACGIFPAGSTMGLEHEDLGVQTVETSAGVGGRRMRAFQDHYMWDAGISVKDWRFIVRIANIDISNLVNETSAADLFKLMIRATHRVHNVKSGRPVFYMNRTMFQMLDIQGRDAVQTGGQLRYVEVDGREIPMFRTIPIRIVDALVETEARVV